MKTKGKKKETEVPVSVLLSRLIRAKGLQKRDVCLVIQKDYDTLKTYTRDPNRMSGHTRKLFAEALGLTIDTLDDLCNGKITSLSQILTSEN